MPHGGLTIRTLTPIGTRFVDTDSVGRTGVSGGAALVNVHAVGHSINVLPTEGEAAWTYLATVVGTWQIHAGLIRLTASIPRFAFVDIC